MTTLTARLTLPSRPRRYKFSLTPLADAMFQLLIFFMLSSSLAPHAILSLRSGGEGQVANTTDGASDVPQGTAYGEVAIWNVANDGVTIGGQVFGFDDLPALATATAGQDAAVLVFIRDTAVVQDLTTVIEALTLAGVSDVQIVDPTS